MARIEVEPGLLAAGGGQESEVASRLLGLGGQLLATGQGAAAAAGDPAAASAMAGFAGAWSTSLATLAEAVSARATNLGAAASAYTGTDAGALPGG